MIIKAIIAFSLLLFVTIPSQSQKIDSLKALVESKRGPERAYVLGELSLNLDKEHQYELALKYAEEGYEISRELNDSLGLIRNGHYVARALRHLGKNSLAISVYEEVLPISKKHSDASEYLMILNGYALSLTFNAQYDKALYYHFEALNFNTGDTISIITTYHNVGLVYYKLKQYTKALDYFSFCFQLKKTVKDDYDLDALLINMGLCYAYLNKFTEGILSIEKALSVCDGACSPRRLIEANFAKGVIYAALQDHVKAEAFFLSSYTTARAENDIRFQLDNIDYLSQLYIRESRDSLATVYLKIAEDLIDKNLSFNLEKIKIYSTLTGLYFSVREFEKAYLYLRKYSKLRDSIFSEEITSNLMNAEAKFLERENANKIAAQNELISVKDEVIVRQNTLNKVIALLGLISGGFVILLFYHYREKRRINRILERKIDERTRELQVSHEKLLTAFNEQNQRDSRAVQAVSETVRRVRSLCRIGLNEVCDPLGRSYISMIDNATSDFQKIQSLRRRE